MKIPNRLLVILILLQLGCTKEIDPQTKFEPQIFIFGMMGNEPDNVRIEIQETVPLKNSTTNPIGNATISLFTRDGFGNSSLVTNSFDVDNGLYTSSQIINAVTGNFYWIEVDVPGRSLFRSEEEQLKPVVPITEVTMNGDMTRVSFEDPAQTTNLYYIDFGFFSGSDFLFNMYELSSDTLFDGNEDAFIETDNVGGNRIKATLFNLNYGTFQYYLNLIAQEDSNSSEGGDPLQLFATPPVNLTGNIVNVASKSAALGNFGVVSSSTFDQSF